MGCDRDSAAVLTDRRNPCGLRDNSGGEVRFIMTEKADALLREALALAPEDRAELATSLIDSLDAAPDAEVEAAWQEEIAKRLDDVRAGRAKLVPWDEVRRTARAILNEKAG